MGSQTSLEEKKNNNNNKDNNNNNENKNNNDDNNKENKSSNETKAFENLNFKKTFSEAFLNENTDSTEYYRNEMKKDEENEEEDEEKEKKIPIEFKWNKGGNMVYITGSFCNWENFFLMEKKSDGTFSITLHIPKGTYQYKYKIDNQWKIDTDAKIVNENGNENNVINTDDFEKQNKTEINNNIINKNKDDNNDNIKNKNNNSKKTNYGCYDFNKGDFNEKPPKIPHLFKKYFDMDYNTKQDKIGNINCFSNIKEKHVLNENGSFKSIYPLFHIHINHMHSKKLINQNTNKQFYLISISLRIKHKNTTIVYYSPKMNN